MSFFDRHGTGQLTHTLVEGVQVRRDATGVAVLKLVCIDGTIYQESYVKFMTKPLFKVWL